MTIYDQLLLNKRWLSDCHFLFFFAFTSDTLESLVVEPAFLLRYWSWAGPPIFRTFWFLPLPASETVHEWRQKEGSFHEADTGFMVSAVLVLASQRCDRRRRSSLIPQHCESVWILSVSPVRSQADRGNLAKPTVSLSRTARCWLQMTDSHSMSCN